MNDPFADLFAHNADARRLRMGVHTSRGRAALRDARASDGAAVHGLLLAAIDEGLGFVSTRAELGEDAEPSLRALRAVEAGDGIGVVAVLDKRVVGYCIARPPGPSRLGHDLHLEVVVDGQHRGQGLGGALLDALIDRARSVPRFRRLSLAVFADNAAAVGLYRAKGFEVEGRRHGVVISDDGSLRDDLLMVLWVGEKP